MLELNQEADIQERKELKFQVNLIEMKEVAKEIGIQQQEDDQILEKADVVADKMEYSVDRSAALIREL